MGSKAEYEARKVDREKRRQAREVLGDETIDIELLDIADRLATAFERIAYALENQKHSTDF